MKSQALNKNIQFLYQYDYFMQTPLHWAAKLGYEKMLEHLAKKIDGNFNSNLNNFNETNESNSKEV